MVATVKISELPAAATVAGTSEFPVVEAGVTSRASKTAIIDGVNLSLELVALSTSTGANQLPSGLNAPLQINYGAGFATGPWDGVSPLEITSTGTTICHSEFLGYVSFSFRTGRAGSGGTAELLLRTLVSYDSGVTYSAQVGETIPISVTDSVDNTPFKVMLPLYCPAGVYLKQEIIRDGGGTNAGGLYQYTPAVSAISPAVSVAQCASILYHKLTT